MARGEGVGDKPCTLEFEVQVFPDDPVNRCVWDPTGILDSCNGCSAVSIDEVPDCLDVLCTSPTPGPCISVQIHEISPPILEFFVPEINPTATESLLSIDQLQSIPCVIKGPS